MDVLESNLRPLLQPITQNLPGPVNDLVESLLGPKCQKSLVHNINLTDTECFKLAISKGLGIGIIGASSVVKIPQLLKLVNSHSAEGISFVSYLLETSAYLISLAYNVRQQFPFSTYGETALIAIQNVAIAVLVLQYSGKSAGAAFFVGGLAAAGYSLFSANVVDMKMLGYLQAGAGVLGVASKVPQILTIWNDGGTGQLSAFAVFNYLAGSLSRIFTTLQEVDDPLILYGFVSGFILNAVLALQMIYYWNSPNSKAVRAFETDDMGMEALVQRAKVTNFGASPTASTTQSQAKSPTTRRRG